VRQDDEPPDVLGPAYRVSPNIPLDVPATLTYKHELPADASNVTIGRVDRADYEAGTGRWVPLPRLTLGTDSVKASDDELALFYALVEDDGTAGTTGDSDADADATADDPTGDPTTDEPGTTSGTPGSESTTEPVTTAPQESSDDGPVEGSSSDDGTEDTGVVYPPECDDIYRGPYEIVFTSQLMPEGGSEDLAMSGDSTFVARNGTGLVQVDANASTIPYELDVPFTSTTLGIRFRADGDLVAAQLEAGELVLIHPDGSSEPFFGGLNFPNGVYPDADGNVWVTEYAGYRVRRIDPDGSGDETIAEGEAEAGGANGIVFDDLRRILFWSKYDTGELWRAPIGEDFAPGAPAMVADLEGFSDGIALDVCGNLYVVDQGGGGQSRIDRVFLDVDGGLLDIEEIAGAGEITAEIANAQFGYGGDFVYEDALYAVGLPGTVFVVHVQINGHPIAPVN
jgi:hypothetical protein